MYDQLIENEDTDSQNRGNMNPVEVTNQSMQRTDDSRLFSARQFGIGPNGQVNLGMAAPLFFPTDMSVI